MLQLSRPWTPLRVLKRTFLHGGPSSLWPSALPSTLTLPTSSSSPSSRMQPTATHCTPNGSKPRMPMKVTRVPLSQVMSQHTSAMQAVQYAGEVGESSSQNLKAHRSAAVAWLNPRGAVQKAAAEARTAVQLVEVLQRLQRGVTTGSVSVEQWSRHKLTCSLLMKLWPPRPRHGTPQRLPRPSRLPVRLLPGSS